MYAIAQLIKRNLKMFFRDHSAVFFSLLSLFIIIGLYALFLGDVFVDNMKNIAGKNTRFLMDSWIMAGLLAVLSVTTTLGAFGIMIYDKTRGVSKDFSASPISRWQIISGYAISSWTIGMIMGIIALILSEVYIIAYGGKLLSLKQIFKVIYIMALSVFSSTAVILFLVLFFKSNNAFATASTIIGTLIGFLSGIYIPIGNLPTGVQTAIKIFPPAHAAALFRQIMMEQPLSLVNAPPEAIEEIKLIFGVVYKSGNSIIPFNISVLILIITGIAFFSLSVVKISLKNH
ncbi:MAG: ABC transporter permease [Xylanivirga thermophila]|jgi:multidrug/hemolysin transport system permease protein|uniref:ABC transporter permease n=1 Tax=Xylanivirga thermophila TaxID=2496273 RepID=UPI001FB4E115|nr:ABC transporter permease [Xylanivirga thermophila]